MSYEAFKNRLCFRTGTGKVFPLILVADSSLREIRTRKRVREWTHANYKNFHLNDTLLFDEDTYLRQMESGIQEMLKRDNEREKIAAERYELRYRELTMSSCMGGEIWIDAHVPTYKELRNYFPNLVKRYHVTVEEFNRVFAPVCIDIKIHKKDGTDLKKSFWINRDLDLELMNNWYTENVSDKEYSVLGFDGGMLMVPETAAALKSYGFFKK